MGNQRKYTQMKRCITFLFFLAASFFLLNTGLHSGDGEIIDTALSDSTDNPSPQIKANGSIGPISVSPGIPVSVAVSLNPGSLAGQNADWWVVQANPSGTFNHYDLSTNSMVPGLLPTHKGPLFSLGSTQLLNVSDLTSGTHIFYFGVDMNMNGSLDLGSLHYDSATVEVTQGDSCGSMNISTAPYNCCETYPAGRCSGGPIDGFDICSTLTYPTSTTIVISGGGKGTRDSCTVEFDLTLTIQPGNVWLCDLVRDYACDVSSFYSCVYYEVSGSICFGFAHGTKEIHIGSGNGIGAVPRSAVVRQSCSTNKLEYLYLFFDGTKYTTPGGAALELIRFSLGDP